MEEKAAPHPPNQLWHQEGAQQLSKAEPRRRTNGDAALATDHAAPPFLGKQSRRNAYFPLRTVTPTSSHRSTLSGELSSTPRAQYCRPPPSAVQLETTTPSR